MVEEKPDICKAAECGDIETVKVLLNKDPELVNISDQRAWMPLHWAVRSGHYDLVKYLIDQGADVNARDLSMYRPLALAIDFGRQDVAELLRDHGGML
jgi:ankyrin repeat protein